MKKSVTCLLLVAVFVTAIFGVIMPLDAKAETSQVILESDFESNDDLNGWYALNNTGNLSIEPVLPEGNALKLSGIYGEWYSPAYNIYPLVKSAGAGTYHFSVKVCYSHEVDVGIYMMLRGASSADSNSFISYDISENYFKRISARHIGNIPGQWFTLTGSVKVLESDIKNETGNFIFCIDGVPTNTGSYVYIDDVKIIKLSDEAITNGNFNDGITGWRTWNPESSDRSDFMVDGNLFARYMRIGTYGSVACNVDQILSYYGPGKYTLSFEIEAVRMPVSGNFTCYFSSNYTNYHKWLGQFSINNIYQWQTVTIPIEILQEEFDLLSADSKEVHFRIQAPDDSYVEYAIDDVSLVPTAMSSFRLTPESNTYNTLVANWNEKLVLYPVAKSPSNATTRCTWESSNESIATVDKYGVVTFKKGGIVTVTATSNSNSNATASVQLLVSYSIPNFTVYGQERNGLCWAAVTKMITQQYVKNVKGNQSVFTDTVTNDILAIKHKGLETYEELLQYVAADNKLNGNFDDAEKLIAHYLNVDSFSATKIEHQSVPGVNPTFSPQNIMNLIDKNIPIYALGHRLNSDGSYNYDEGHTYAIYGYTFQQNGEFTLITYDPVSRSFTGAVDIFKYDDFNNGTIADRYSWDKLLYIDHTTNN